ncbi:hypothetical protein ElyMa_006106500 [Elysia marginata]|uniref:Uncharacterized protein n=1 Tax=Elysia marginata TaxID=1093978 RepID=A0AAV4GTQ6_9GAST|nr:hypothetical protein ElyMa_006106500 [Elysia marginata]
MLLAVGALAAAVHITDASLTHQVIFQLHKISEVPTEDIQDFCKVILMSLENFVNQVATCNDWYIGVKSWSTEAAVGVKSSDHTRVLDAEAAVGVKSSDHTRALDAEAAVQVKGSDHTRVLDAEAAVQVKGLDYIRALDTEAAEQVKGSNYTRHWIPKLQYKSRA